MEFRKIANIIVKIMMPLTLGGAILYWMYRGFDFNSVGRFMLNDMN